MLWASQARKVTQIYLGEKMIVSRYCKAAHVSVIQGGGVGFRTSRGGGRASVERGVGRYQVQKAVSISNRNWWSKAFSLRPRQPSNAPPSSKTLPDVGPKILKNQRMRATKNIC